MRNQVVYENYCEAYKQSVFFIDFLNLSECESNILQVYMILNNCLHAFLQLLNADTLYFPPRDVLNLIEQHLGWVHAGRSTREWYRHY